MTHLIELTKWVERIDNILNLQKEVGYDLNYMQLTRRETIELILYLNTLLEMEKKKCSLR